MSQKPASEFDNAAFEEALFGEETTKTEDFLGSIEPVELDDTVFNIDNLESELASSNKVARADTPLSDKPSHLITKPTTPAVNPNIQDALGTTDTHQAVAPIVPPPTKKPLFNVKNKKSKAEKLPTPKTKSGDPKKLNFMIIGAALALVLLVLAYFLSNSEKTPEPIIAQESTTLTETPVESAPTPTPTETEVVAAPAVPSENGTGEHGTELIDVNAILQSEVPEDPALIKEEIDRLSDKDQRLSEQAKLIDEQLTMMEELTAAKEEQIALLEAQIAQLEAKRGN